MNKPIYHITPEKGWMNDPNGLVEYNGVYHVFYQADPEHLINENIGWGHKISSDLLHWEECQPALLPDQSYDRDGCFTGSAVIKDDKMYLLYTGHVNQESGYIETQNLAVSKDGIHFEVDEHPAIFPLAEEESWGMEDPRITKIDDRYYINYTSVTENGAGTSLISTKDFCTFERHGIIFAPENKDVTIFPQKINGKYIAFNRPVPSGIGNPQMWIAKSPDLIHWGEQRHFCGISSDTESWDDGRIGGGAVPFLTDKGWVKIYHAADRNDRYCLGAFLLDEKDPSIVLAKTKDPILEPQEKYETNGFFGNVVFSCGCLVNDNKVIIYYGAADDKICRADFELDDLFAAMEYFDV